MQNREKILDGLQVIVTNLAAQSHGHVIQSKIFRSQGYSKLAQKYADHTAEEQGYVEQCMARILDLGDTPKNEATQESPVSPIRSSG